jgi:hypothetical protein
MAFPLGVTVTTRTAPPTPGIPTATDTWFVAANTDVGDETAATQVFDLPSFEAAFGDRTAGNIALWDAMDVFFREGGKRAYIVVTANATTLPDALELFTRQLGPGQVSAIGLPIDDAAYEALWSHAAENNRIVIGDIPGPSVQLVSDLTTLADAVSDQVGGYGGLFGPWVVVPGPQGVAGVSERQVPASPVIAALCARVDETGNPNQAAAGRAWPLQYVSDFTQVFADLDRVDLLDAGVNLFAEVYGLLENYGFQTTVDQQEDSPFWQLNCSRMRMALVAQASAIGEHYLFRPIDGRGLLANAFKGDLTAMLLGYYGLNSLYGNTPQEAFAVEVGETVNTIDTIAQGMLKAVCSVVLTLHAKAVQIELVTVPIGGTV